MTNWEGFRSEAPELAGHAERLFDKSGVILLGTIRKDGSPRISPVEPVIVSGELYLGMMWRSYKALDLLRDPRCTVHSSLNERMAPDGEFKLHGRATDIRDPETRRMYGEALYKKIGWNPEGMKYHLFSVDIVSAAYFTNEEVSRLVKRWRLGQSVEEYRQTI